MANISARRKRPLLLLAFSRWRVLSILLLLVAVVLPETLANDLDPNDDPNNPCSSHALNQYRACVQDNACVCQNCEPDPSDPNWVIEAAEPNSCQDISRIFCPLIRCCSPCEDIFSFYHSCLADQIASIYLGESHPCQLFICSNSHDDYTGACAPTDAPVEPPNPCEIEASDYLDCVAGDASCAMCIPTDVTQLHLPSNTRNCQQMNHEVFCPLERCCTPCHKQLDTLTSCVESKIVASDDGTCPGGSTRCPTTPSPTPLPTVADTTDKTPGSTLGTQTSGAPKLIVVLPTAIISGLLLLLML